jgi:hypothetical protein
MRNRFGPLGAGMPHVSFVEPCRQLRRDVTRAIVGWQTRPMRTIHPFISALVVQRTSRRLSGRPDIIGASAKRQPPFARSI